MQPPILDDYYRGGRTIPPLRREHSSKRRRIGDLSE